MIGKLSSVGFIKLFMSVYIPVFLRMFYDLGFTLLIYIRK